MLHSSGRFSTSREFASDAIGGAWTSGTAVDAKDREGLRPPRDPDTAELDDDDDGRGQADDAVGGVPAVGPNTIPITFGPTVVNGSPALVVHLDGELDGVLVARVEAGRITGLYVVRNLEKLSRIESETPLALR